MRLVKNFFVVLSIALSPYCFGDIAGVPDTFLDRILVDSQNFGGCMVLPRTYNEPAGCGRGWVALDCDGNFISKEAARRSLETIQMAVALEKKVYMTVDTSMLINGYCVAKRIDLIN